MRTRTLLLLLICTAVTLGLLFTNTNPESLPIGFFVLPIVLLFLLGFLITAVFLRIMRVFESNERKRHIVAIMGGLLGVFWVIMQSAGGVTPGDMVLIAVITVLSLFYITKY